MGNFRSDQPLGTTDVKVLLGNASNFDEAMHEKILRYWLDRFGRQRLTWHGIEEQFQEFLLNAGYQDMGDYAAGLELTARNQMFHKDGELYRASAALVLPYTITGNWAQEKDLFVAMGDQALRQQLADKHDPSRGSGMIGGLGLFSENVFAARSMALRVGDIVHIQGYYSRGDGGGSTIKAVPASDAGGFYLGYSDNLKLRIASLTNLRQLGAGFGSANRVSSVPFHHQQFPNSASPSETVDGAALRELLIMGGAVKGGGDILNISHRVRGASQVSVVGYTYYCLEEYFTNESSSGAFEGFVCLDPKNVIELTGPHPESQKGAGFYDLQKTEHVKVGDLLDIRSNKERAKHGPDTHQNFIYYCSDAFEILRVEQFPTFTRVHFDGEVETNFTPIKAYVYELNANVVETCVVDLTTCPNKVGAFYGVSIFTKRPGGVFDVSAMGNKYGGAAIAVSGVDVDIDRFSVDGFENIQGLSDAGGRNGYGISIELGQRFHISKSKFPNQKHGISVRNRDRMCRDVYVDKSYFYSGAESPEALLDSHANLLGEFKVKDSTFVIDDERASFVNFRNGFYRSEGNKYIAHSTISSGLAFEGLFFSGIKAIFTDDKFSGKGSAAAILDAAYNVSNGSVLFENCEIQDLPRVFRTRAVQNDVGITFRECRFRITGVPLSSPSPIVTYMFGVAEDRMPPTSLQRFSGGLAFIDCYLDDPTGFLQLAGIQGDPYPCDMRDILMRDNTVSAGNPSTPVQLVNLRAGRFSPQRLMIDGNTIEAAGPGTGKRQMLLPTPKNSSNIDGNTLVNINIDIEDSLFGFPNIAAKTISTNSNQLSNSNILFGSTSASAATYSARSGTVNSNTIDAGSTVRISIDEIPGGTRRFTAVGNAVSDSSWKIDLRNKQSHESLVLAGNTVDPS